jgi:Ca2+-binding RTX toxin-like protein
MGASLTAADTINGGSFTNTVELNGDYSSGLTFGASTISNVQTLKLDGGHSYNLTTNDANVAAGNFLSVDASALGAGNALIFDGSAETNGHLDLVGGAGNDVLRGGSGNDVFSMDHNLTAADTIDGGGGADTLDLAGVYGPALTFSATTLTNVENIVLAHGDTTYGEGFSYRLITNDATVAAGAVLHVDASALFVPEFLAFDGSAETDGSFNIIAGGANDILTGGALGDTFDLSHSRHDTVHGGGGNDSISLGAAFTASDSIDGGTGSGDTLNLSGDYSGGLTFGAATLTNVENIVLAAGYSYSLTTNDATVASGQTLTVDASPLIDSHKLTFDGSAELDGSFRLIGGTGKDTLTGGSGNDTFIGGAGNDTFNGGAGSDTADYSSDTAGVTVNLSGSSANGSLTGIDTLNGIENVTGGSGDDSLTGLASAATVFDLSYGGNDTASGGSGNDTFNMGANLTAGDAIDGGAGTDTLNLNGDYSAGLTFGPTTLTNVEDIVLAAGHSYSLTTNDATVASGQTLTVDASALGAGDALTFDGSAETDGFFAFTGGTGADSFTVDNRAVFLGSTFDGGAGNDTLTLNYNYNNFNISTLGANTLHGIEKIVFEPVANNYALTSNDANVAAGQTLTLDASALTHSLNWNGVAETDGFFDFKGGAGSDVLTIGSETVLTDSKFDGGGAGNNTLILNGDFSAAFTFTAAEMTNVQSLNLSGSHSYHLTSVDAVVAAGASLNVTASATAVYFDGSAETDGRFNFSGSNGNDTWIGGAGNDSFFAQNGADTMTGGGGVDSFLYSFNNAQGVAQSTSTHYDTITDINFSVDTITPPKQLGLPSGIDAAINGGALSTATFDSDLATAVDSNHLAAVHAVLFTADSGDLSGHTFLVVDENGQAGYQTAADLVIDVTGYTGTLSTSSFI